jgi:hypothetical protein
MIFIERKKDSEYNFSLLLPLRVDSEGLIYANRDGQETIMKLQSHFLYQKQTAD